MMDVLNTNLMDNENSNLLNVKYYEKHYGVEGDTEAEGEQETEDEDNTQYESEESEIGDSSDTDLPKFRDLVRAKKEELKSQYGKAHIENHSVMERECKNVQVPKIRMVDKEICVNVPFTKWDSNINCSSICVKWNWKTECTEHQTKCLGGFIGGTNRECKNVPTPEGYTELEEVCINVPKIRLVWVSGWRKKWREFKRDGGLAQLKLQSKGLYTPPSSEDNYIPPQPTYTPPQQQQTPPEPEFDEYQEWSCQELSNEFGIIGGQTFGTAPTTAINSWRNRNCNTKPIVDATEPEVTEEESTNVEDSKPIPKTKPKSTAKKTKKISDDKILGMPKDIAIAVGIAVVLIGGFALIRKKG